MFFLILKILKEIPSIILERCKRANFIRNRLRYKRSPIYVDGQMVGISPLNGSIDVLPGWHKVGYFPNDYSRDSNKLTSKEKILNDILVMGRLDVFVEEGKHETIVLNYQTLDEEVIDYNKKFQTGTVVGFSLFFTMILLMSWGLA